MEQQHTLHLGQEEAAITVIVIVVSYGVFSSY